MTSLARHHTRWCLIATATLLMVAFAYHDVSAQFRPPPNRPPGTGVSGNSGAGFNGVQGGGFSGNSGAGFSGMQNNFSGASGFSGVSGFSGGIGGSRFEYYCSKCKQKVSQFDTRCPHCGVLFTGTTFMPMTGGASGAGGALGNSGGNNFGQFGGGSPPQGNPGTFPPQGNAGNNPPQNNPGNNPPASQPPADNLPPADAPKADAPSSGSSGSSAKSGSKDDKESGLSTALIVGVSIAALGLFAVIAGLVVVMNSGGRPAKKSRPRRFHDDDYD